MHWIDWLIVVVPVTCVLGLAIYSRRYVRGVADYLAAGRVAGRYVISVGDLAAGASVIGLASMVEMKYRVGFATTYWMGMMTPIMLLMGLTGFCVYRFRETKSLSLGQFLEMRYNRTFRVFAASLRTIADVCCNAVGPIVTANVFIYFVGLPHQVSLFGISFPTFPLIVGCILFLAMLVIWPGGRIGLLLTDSVQGLLLYPIAVTIVVFIVVNYSFFGEIAPVMMDRVAGESFLNPFDVEKLRDFNVFAMLVLIFGRILNRASWIGNDTSGAGRNAHEQKMAGILGSWRGAVFGYMCVLVMLVILTTLTHEHFAGQAKTIRSELSTKVVNEVVADKTVRHSLCEKLAAIPTQHHKIGVDKPLSQKNNLDTPYMDVAGKVLKGDGEGNLLFLKFRSLYSQMLMPVTLRSVFPHGMLGLFCLLMVMMMISTDDSRIMNCSSTIFQDIIMPFFKKELTPQRHIFLLRITSLVIVGFFMLFAMFFSQLDYILMTLTIIGAVWLGGAGPVMIFGLYSRFGNTVGAFSSLLVGSGISVVGFIVQRNWADIIYPFIDRMGWNGTLDTMLRTVSSPFSPYVAWKMDAVKFPINSYEIYFIAMVGGIVAYVTGSLITYRKPYNLERMLHRGEYSIDGEKKVSSPWTWKNVFSKMIGITPEYTRGDKIIAWVVFVKAMIYGMGCWFTILVWNMISPWPTKWFANWFFASNLIIAGIIAAVSTVWFMIGGVIDIRRLFVDLAKRVDNPLDDGRVKGHVSLMDVEKIGCDSDKKD